MESATGESLSHPFGPVLGKIYANDDQRVPDARDGPHCYGAQPVLGFPADR